MVYLKKILNLLVKKGKKGIAVKNLTVTLEELRGNRGGLTPKKLSAVFDKLVPSVKIAKKKVAGKVYQIPTPIKEERAVFQTAKWFLEGIKTEKKGEKLSTKLGKQLVKTSQGKGVVISERKK